MVTMVARRPCMVCGCAIKTLRFSNVAVNKRSLRETGRVMEFDQHRCPECGHPTSASPVDLPTVYRLDPGDQRKVAEYRAKRFKMPAGSRVERGEIV